MAAKFPRSKLMYGGSSSSPPPLLPLPAPLKTDSSSKEEDEVELLLEYTDSEMENEVREFAMQLRKKIPPGLPPPAENTTTTTAEPPPPPPAENTITATTEPPSPPPAENTTTDPSICSRDELMKYVTKRKEAGLPVSEDEYYRLNVGILDYAQRKAAERRKRQGKPPRRSRGAPMLIRTSSPPYSFKTMEDCLDYHKTLRETDNYYIDEAKYPEGHRAPPIIPVLPPPKGGCTIMDEPLDSYVKFAIENQSTLSKNNKKNNKKKKKDLDLEFVEVLRCTSEQVVMGYVYYLTFYALDKRQGKKFQYQAFSF